MSEEYERMMELREPLMTIADAATSIALALEKLEITPGDNTRLRRLEAILLDLYPDSCKRHGLGLPAAAGDGRKKIPGRPIFDANGIAYDQPGYQEPG